MLWCFANMMMCFMIMIFHNNNNKYTPARGPWIRHN